MKYDIFVSYRRASSDTANLIAEKLRGRGYNVFFDVESLRGGKFNEQLFKVIEEVKDVVVVLPQNALERCSDYNDWVRLEVCHAITNGKNIIPVMLNGFEWPEHMPEGMEALREYQAVTATSYEYFDMAISRLCGYVKSKPHRRIRKAAIVMLCIMVVVVAAYGVSELVFRRMAVPICKELGDKLTMKVSLMDILASESVDIEQYWSDYKQKKILANEMKLILDSKESSLIRLSEQNEACNFSPTNFQKFLLGGYGIDGSVLDMLNTYYLSYFSSYKDNLMQLKCAVEKCDTTIPTLKSIDAFYQAFRHDVHAAYYSYLELMSCLPKDAQKSYWQTGHKLENVPNGVGLNQSHEAYEQFVNREMQEIEKILSGVRRRNIDLEEDVRLANEKFEDLNNEILQMYSSFKLKNKLTREDTQMNQWGKIAQFGKVLAETVIDYRESAEQGLEPGPIPPKQIYEDLCANLEFHLKCYPKAEPYVLAAKLFYKEVYHGKRDCSGLMIGAFKDNMIHSQYQLGDIVLEIYGNKLTGLESLEQSEVNKRSPEVRFLRVQDGVFVEIVENKIDSEVLVMYLSLGK